MGFRNSLSFYLVIGNGVIAATVLLNVEMMLQKKQNRITLLTSITLLVILHKTRNTTFFFQVKLLEQEYISVMLISGVLLEDMDEYLANIDALSIRPLTAAVLPQSTLTRTITSNVLTITAYALDVNNNLLSTEEVQG